MSTSTFIAKILVDLFFYELVWVFIKKGKYPLKILKRLMKILIYLNLFILLGGGGIHTFVNLYFMTMWYFVIYPDRILNELTEEEVKGPVA